MLRQIDVSAESVASGDTFAFPQILGPKLEPEKARELQGTIVFMFPELEVDEVPIFDMPGVVDWLALLHERIPHLVYFLQPTPAIGALEGLLRTFLPREPLENLDPPGQIPLTPEILARLAERLIVAAAFATHNGDDWEPIITRFIEPLEGQVQEVLMETVRQSLN